MDRTHSHYLNFGVDLAHTPHKLPVWHYDASKQYWSSDDRVIRQYRKPQKEKFLRIATYNIWFSQKHQPLRFHSLCAILEHSKAQVICLQEMTKSILEELISQSWVQERYLLSDVDGRTFSKGPETYGVLMLIDKHLQFREFLSFPFHTRQGRQLLFAQIQLRTERFLIGTVHLESIRLNKVFRSQQLHTCQSVFNRYAMKHPNVTRLLMGDFNFDADWPENATQMNILRNLIDLWPKLNGSSNPGLTYGNVRFDRIMFRSLRVIPIHIQIIGDQPIQQLNSKGNLLTNIFNRFLSHKQNQDETNVFPSDHFGLMADFDLIHI